MHALSCGRTAAPMVNVKHSRGFPDSNINAIYPCDINDRGEIAAFRESPLNVICMPCSTYPRTAELRTDEGAKRKIACNENIAAASQRWRALPRGNDLGRGLASLRVLMGHAGPHDFTGHAGGGHTVVRGCTNSRVRAAASSFAGSSTAKLLDVDAPSASDTRVWTKGFPLMRWFRPGACSSRES